MESVNPVAEAEEEVGCGARVGAEVRAEVGAGGKVGQEAQVVAGAVAVAGRSLCLVVSVFQFVCRGIKCVNLWPWTSGS